MFVEIWKEMLWEHFLIFQVWVQTAKKEKKSYKILYLLSFF